jgi:PTH1 family peptidyl-tRNA hydrolase
VKLIVGLGNPGILYANTRHNAGFMAVKALARILRCGLKKEKGIPALSGKGKINGEEIILALPLTFMNLSGRAVNALLRKYPLAPEGLLVVADDLDLPLGRLRIRASGSSAGQRGLKSVIEALGSQEFARLRIGIGRPGHKAQAAGYVLSRFNAQEKRALKAVIEKACQCCAAWAKDGIHSAMNEFNHSEERDSNE